MLDWLQGKLVITGSKDATLRIWDLTSGVCIQTLKKHLGACL
jgi:WD40 repeat protein|eukprot:COSAG02_NODE_5894_length_3956_cov_4.285196_8_plen_42_part_00